MGPVEPASPSKRAEATRPVGIADVFVLVAVPYLPFLDWLLPGTDPDADALMASQALP